MFTKLRSLIRDNAGITSLEYGVLAAIIVVGLVAMLPAVTTALGGTFTAIEAVL